MHIEQVHRCPRLLLNCTAAAVPAVEQAKVWLYWPQLIETTIKLCTPCVQVAPCSQQYMLQLGQPANSEFPAANQHPRWWPMDKVLSFLSQQFSKPARQYLGRMEG